MVMLETVMLGSGQGGGKRERYPNFYLHCHSRFIMNRGEQETLFRQSRQLTRIVPSREDLVLSVLKAPITQQQPQFQHSHYPHSPQEHHVNCQAHQTHKRCTHPPSGINKTKLMID